MTCKPCPVDWHAYIEGELSQSQASDMDAHLEFCVDCRSELDKQKKLIRLLGRADEAFQDVDLSDALLQASREESDLRDRRSRILVWVLAGFFLAAMSAGLWAWSWNQPSSAPHDPEAFRVKALRDGVPESDRWVAILPYRLLESGRTQRLGEQMAKDEALLLAYTNLGPKPYSYLMVFAVDARGRIHWYHPAYEKADEDPQSTPISKSSTGVELKEAIRHDLASGTLRLVAVFSHKPWRVSEIERMVGDMWDAGSWWESTRLPITDSGQHFVTTEVGP